MEKNKTKFKVGDKVKILPSATIIGVSESEVGKVAEIKRIISPDEIMIYAFGGKDYGYWCVNDNDIAIAIKPGQQLLFNFME